MTQHRNQGGFVMGLMKSFPPIMLKCPALIQTLTFLMVEAKQIKLGSCSSYSFYFAAFICSIRKSIFIAEVFF